MSSIFSFLDHENISIALEINLISILGPKLLAKNDFSVMAVSSGSNSRTVKDMSFL